MIRSEKSRVSTRETAADPAAGNRPATEYSRSLILNALPPTHQGLGLEPSGTVPSIPPLGCAGGR